jgi:hypothetical protein
VPVWSRGEWGGRFAGIVGGLLCDFIAEGAATGLAATWVVDFSPRPVHLGGEQPVDALAALGDECGRPAYAAESPADHRVRLQNKWAFWTGPPKDGLSEELAAAGYGAPRIIVPNDWVSPPDSQHPDYWSRFWVQWDIGTHPFTGPGTIWAEYVVGNNTLLGPEGITEGYMTLLARVIRQNKPVQWVPWQYRFTLATTEIHIQARPMIDPDWVYYQ